MKLYSHPSALLALMVVAGALATGCGDEDPQREPTAAGSAAPSPLALDVPAEARESVGKLAFVAAHDTTSDVFVLQPGQEPVNITRDDAENAEVAWSPDGSRLVYGTVRNGTLDLVVANADGSDTKPLTELPGREVTPSWSPDGKRVAFAVEDGGYAIYVVQADTGRATKLIEDGCYVGSPTWSPDGHTIIFDRDCTEGGDIHVYSIPAGGGKIRALTPSTGEQATPAFSPDGKRVAVVVGRDLFTMKPNGRSWRRIAEDLPVDGVRPAWSGDGSKLLFVGEGGSDLYMLDPSTGKSVQLTREILVSAVSAVAH